jgi:hypothetical protein
MGNLLYILGVFFIIGWAIVLFVLKASLIAFLLLYVGIFAILVRIILGKQII